MISVLERNEIRSRVIGMSEEEKKIAVKCMPINILQEEIDRRNEVARNKLDMVYVALAKSPNTDLHDIMCTLNELKDILEIGKKDECW